MTLDELVKRLKEAGFDTAYKCFDHPPNIPFVAYLIPNESHWGDDTKNRLKKMSVKLELYTDRKDQKSEQIIEAFLDFAQFEKSEDYISDEELYMVVYEFDIFEKY